MWDVGKKEKDPNDSTLGGKRRSFSDKKDQSRIEF
jgi:hypothetical protein